MTREPVRYRPPDNRLAFPFNIRAGIGIWKRLYFRAGPYRPNPAKSAAWNRGAYLAEGLGHCGSGHTPRNTLAAERNDHAYDRRQAAGWHAHANNEPSEAPLPRPEGAQAPPPGPGTPRHT